MKKKSLHFVLTRVFNTPLMIHPQKLSMIENFLRARMPAEVFFDSDEEDDSADEIETGRSGQGLGESSNIAVIPVYGSLVQRNVNISDCFTSYASLERQLNKAVEDPAIQGILFDVDSCGGEANGCFELVDRIFEAREKKPIIGLGNEQAFSGGYAILSACEKVWIPKTGNVGSVGVIMTHFDYSKMADKDGVAITHIIAGKKKADGSPYKPLSPQALKDFQSEVNKIYDVFVKSVARNRGISEDAVRGTEAGTFMGPSALKAGLVDEVISLADLPAKLTEAIMKKQTTQAGASANGKKLETPVPGQDPPPPVDPGDEEEEETSVEVPAEDEEDEEEEIPPKKKAPAATEGDAATAVANARKTAAEITKMCAAVGKPNLAAKLIESGLSVGAAKAKLFDLMADGEAVLINAVDDATSDNEGTPLMVNAMKKLNEQRSKAR